MNTCNILVLGNNFEIILDWLKVSGVYHQITMIPYLCGRLLWTIPIGEGSGHTTITFPSPIFYNDPHSYGSETPTSLQIWKRFHDDILSTLNLNLHQVKWIHDIGDCRLLKCDLLDCWSMHTPQLLSVLSFEFTGLNKLYLTEERNGRGDGDELGVRKFCDERINHRLNELSQLILHNCDIESEVSLKKYFKNI